VLSNTAYLSMPLDWDTALMRLRFGLLPIVALLPWPLVLALQLPGEQRHGWRVIILVISVWLLAAAIDVTLPLKFWKHYFNALLPPLSLAAGLGMVQISRRLQQRRVWATTAMAGVVSIPAFLLMIKHMHDSRSIDRTNVPQAVAQRIRDSGDRDVYVFDYDPLVYSYADAKPPTRFVLGIELANFDASSGARPLREVDKVLAHRPDWIVVAEPSPYKFSPAVLQQLDHVLRDYRVDAEWREADYIQPPIQVRLYQRVATGAEQQPNEHPDHG
jgi:hypothetical protein